MLLLMAALPAAFKPADAGESISITRRHRMNPNLSMDTEQVCYGYNVTENITTEYALHCHNFYEVYLFLEGDVDYLVEGEHYNPTPNSLLLLSPHLFHGVRINSCRPYRRFSIHFHPDILSLERRAFLLSSFPSAERRDLRIYYEQVDRMDIPCYFEALEDCAAKPEPYRSQLLPICVEALLARIVSMSSQTQQSGTAAGQTGTVTEILLYLNRHLQEPFSLDKLAQRFFISKHHLNKVFRKATGTTVFDYLLHKRVTLAQQLLIGGHSAQEAALLSGFGDYSSFYRSYTRILGHSPLQDRGVLPSFSASGEGLASVELREN